MMIAKTVAFRRAAPEPAPPTIKWQQARLETIERLLHEGAVEPSGSKQLVEERLRLEVSLLTAGLRPLSHDIRRHIEFRIQTIDKLLIAPITPQQQRKLEAQKNDLQSMLRAG